MAGKARGEPKRGSLPWLTIETDFPTHPQDQLEADDQAEARSAKASSGGAISLNKGLEKFGLCFRRNSYSRIGDGESDSGVGLGFLFAMRPYDDLAPLGKFYGVPDEIRKNLSQTAWIASQTCGDALVGDCREINVFSGGSGRKKFHGTFDDRAELKVDFFKDEHSRLNLREVENVVNNHEESIRALGNRLGKVALFWGQIGVKKELRHSNDSVHGRPNFMAHICQKLAF